VLGERRAHQQAAVASALDRHLVLARVLGIHHVLGRGIKVVKNVLLAGQVALVVPLLTELPAAADIGLGGDHALLGGQTGPLIEKFQAGYQAGIAAIDKNITVHVEYIGDSTKAFNDAIQGEALSNMMYDNGACIIYHAAGKSGLGLFKAAAAQKKLAIGVDSDQYKVVTPDQAQWILTSMIKRVDTATFDTIKAAADNSFKGGTAEVFTLADDGLSYSTSNTALMTPDMIKVVDEWKQKIISGSVTPPTAPPKP
jgi:basic membrane protein A